MFYTLLRMLTGIETTLLSRGVVTKHRVEIF
jgi:hypothetical protein